MTRVLLIIVLLISSFSSYSQNWMTHSGGAGNDEALDIEAGPAGDFFIAGYYSYGADFNGTVLQSAGQVDAFLARTDGLGNVQWVKQFGGSGADKAYACDLDPDGNIYVAGYYSGTMTVESVTLTSTNATQDIFLAKLDPLGNLLWMTDFGGADHDFLFDLEVDYDGNAVITGQFKGTITVGNDTYNSVLDPEDLIPSYDIFLVKYDPSGNVIWSKQGAADQDDRGTGLAITSDNRIAMIGQFSDTLSLDSTYFNQVYNSGFVMMIAPDGEELWLTKMSASLCMPRDIVVYNDSLLYVTGDFSGQLAVFDDPIVFTTSPFIRKIFVMKMDDQGHVIWLDNDGSNSGLSSTSIDVDASGNAYISGYFNCRFDEYSQAYGSGIFYSAGHRDIFVTRYDNDGARNWMRHFGGAQDDISWDLVTAGNVNQPVITGSFDRTFNAPNGGNFLPTGFDVPVSWDAPNSSGQNYCGDNYYGNFAVMQSVGHRDILMSRPVDLSRQPYDYFNRSGFTCILDTIAPCINACQDTVETCNSFYNLSFTPWSGTQGYIGPEFDLLWSTGETSNSIDAHNSTTYFLEIDRKDGCYSTMDSIEVILHPSPTHPWISDDVIVNTDAADPNRIFSCYPDTVLLTISNVDTLNNIYGWGNSNEITSFSLDTLVTETGQYFAYHIDSIPCQDNNMVEVYIDDWANEDTLDPHILINAGGNWFDCDTLVACNETLVYFTAIDSAHYNSVGLSMPYVLGEWSVTFSNPSIGDMFFTDQNLENGLDDLDQWSQGGMFSATGATWVTIDAVLYDLCNEDTSMYTLHHEFYVEVNSVQEHGERTICPGDTTLAWLVGSGPYEWEYYWSGPTVIPPATNDSVLLAGVGTYNWTANLYIDSVLICSASDTFNVNAKEAPEITMIPNHGVICPNDSAELIAPPGSGYTWIGPNNAIVGSVQSIYVDAPGFYHCEFTDTVGCYLISDPVEVLGFNSPYLYAEPQEFVCEGQSVNLVVFANEGTLINWPPPLIDGLVEQEVSQPGTYTVVTTFCDITDSLTITVFDASPVVELTLSGPDTICDGEILNVNAPNGYFSYQWSTGSQDPSIEVTDSGAYFVTVETLDGCIGHSDTLDVAVLYAPPAPSVSDTIVCSGELAELFVLNQPDSVFWFNSNNDSLDFNTVLTIDSVIDNMEIYAANFEGECFSIYDTAYVDVYLGSAILEMQGDTGICPGDSLILWVEEVADVIYTWTLPDSSQVSGSTLALANPQPGTYQVLIEHPQCDVQLIIQEISVIQSGNYEVILLDGDTVNCEGTLVTVGISPTAGAITWYPDEVADSIFHPTESGFIWAELEANSGCNVTSDSLEIIFNEAPSTLVFPDTTVCPGDSATLSIEIDNDVFLAQYQGPIPVTNEFSSGPLVTDSIFGFYQVDSIGCASDTGYWAVSVAAIPSSLNLIVDTAACFGDSVTIATSPNGYVTYYSLADTLLGLGASAPQNPLTVFADSDLLGNGIFAIMDTAGCTVVSDTIAVAVHPVPDIPIITGDTLACSGDSLFLQGSSFEDVTYIWTGPNNFQSNDSLLQFSPITALDSGLFQLVVQQGICFSDTAEIMVVLAPMPQVILNDFVLCAGTEITLEVPDIYEQILWSTLDSSTSVAIADSGLYWIEVFNSFGCSFTDSMAVSFSETYSLELMYGDTVNCEGDEVLLGISNVADSVIWQPASLSGLTYAPFSTEIIWAEVVDSNGCNLVTDSMLITFNEQPLPLQVTDTIICPNTEAQVVFNSLNETYVIENGVGTLVETVFETDPLLAETTFGFYQVDSVGCVSDTTDWQVLLIPVPEELELIMATEFCSGDTILLLSNPQGSVTYFDVSGDDLGSGGGDLQNSLQLLAYNSNVYGGVYAVMDTSGCSVTSSTVDIEIFLTPSTPELIGDTLVCPGDSIYLEAFSSNNSVFNWTGPSGFQLTGPALEFNPLDSVNTGIYAVTAQLGDCISDISTLELAFSPAATVQLFEDTVLCSELTLDMEVDAGFADILWSTGESLPHISVADSGLYWVWVANDFGCEDSDSILVSTITCLLEIGNAFTPNGDGMNDRFLVSPEDLESIDVKIYNRFGRFIYGWTELDGYWDGSIKNNGIDAEDGTYFYVVDFTDAAGQFSTKKGYVQLMR